MSSTRCLRVMVVAESALLRTMLARGLSADPELLVVGTENDPHRARDLLLRERPDVLMFDIDMQRMDAIACLKLLLAARPVATIIVSSLEPTMHKLALMALKEGAVDVVEKPHYDVAEGLTRRMAELVARVKMAPRDLSRRRVSVAPVARALSLPPVVAPSDSVIGLAASAGGVAALRRILPLFPVSSPGIVIVQHMPAGFTADFAHGLDSVSSVRVSEAKHGDRVRAGTALVAPGGEQHLELHRVNGELHVALVAGAAVAGHVPSVDVFFESLARAACAHAVGCVLTGMGEDGAEGLLALRLRGGRTFAQDRETSAVWGMPAAALERGAAEVALPLDEIPARLLAAACARRAGG